MFKQIDKLLKAGRLYKVVNKNLPKLKKIKRKKK